MSEKKKAAKKGQPGKKTYTPATILVLFILFFLGMIAILLLHSAIEEKKIRVEDGHLVIAETPAPAPEPTPEPEFYSDYDEEEIRGYYEAMREENPYVYANSEKLSCDLSSYIHLTLGLGNDFNSTGIYLEPTLTYDYAMNTDEAYVFLIRASNGQIRYSGEPGGQIDGQQFYYLAERTYDRIVSSSFDYDAVDGLKWCIDLMDGDADKTGAELNIHAIRIRDGFLMGAAKATIEYDPETGLYSLVSLVKSDVSSTGELSADERETLVHDAISFINEGNDNFTLEITQSEYLNNQDFIVVEKLNRVLYNRLFDSKGRVAPAGRFLRYTTYAVNIPDDGHGYITVYFGPTAEIRGYNPNATEQFTVFGYDAWMAFSVNSFNAYLIPEDAEEFGVS